MPFRLGPTELIIILVIILIIFGAGKLPQIGSAFGKSIKEFRKEASGKEEKKPEEPKAKASKKSQSTGVSQKEG